MSNGTNDREAIRQWLEEHINVVIEGPGPGTGPVLLVGLVHHAHSGEVALHSLNARQGGPVWGKPEAMAEMLDSIATRHARGISGGGAQQFSLTICREGGKPVAVLPFARVGAAQVVGANGSLATEPPTATGMVQQAQRWGEIVLQGATQTDLAVTQLMAGMIKELRDAYKDMFAESRELFLGLRKLSIETAAAQQEQGLRLILAKRNAALAHEGIKLLPAALNGLTGREIFPSGTADTVHLRNIMLMFDEEQLGMYGRAVAAKGPEAEAAFGLLVNRLAELKKQEATEERRLREVLGERNPDYEAAEHDAAGLIDPRKVLNGALNKAARSNADAPPPGAAKALGNGHGPTQPAAAPAPQDAAKTETDPFVLRLFEGAGPQEIQVLASMYEARGLTDVASELRGRFAEYEKGQTP